MVEEDVSLRFMMREIARALDVNIDIVASLDEGMDRLKCAPEDFGLLLLDMHLSDREGRGIGHLVHAHDCKKICEIPIIFVSDEYNIRQAETLDDLQIHGLLLKPVTPAELLNLVDTYCVAART